MRFNKRATMIALGIVGIIAIVVSAFVALSGNTHAAAGGNNPYVLSSNYLSTHHAKAGFSTLGPQGGARGQVGKVNHGHPTSSCVPGIQGVSNWCGTFSEKGFDAFGNPNSSWTFNMLGNPAQAGKTTTFDSPVIPVKLVLLDSNGNAAFTVDPQHDVQPTLNSPVFQNTKYSSSDKPTQFGDAVQRAEFHSVMKNSWHTMLAPSVKPEVTMTIPSGHWFVGLNPDGSVLFSLVDSNTFNTLLFPAANAPVDNSTIIGSEELNGTMTTKNISTFLFDNTYLYLNGDPNQCCVLGFHGPDIEPGPNGTLNNFDMIYDSWTTPGLFQGGAADITPLSHEVSETFNDPFSGAYFPFAYVPWWFSGPTPGFTQCQPLMEVGDVVEVYSVIENDVFPITIGGVTYHPQTEALLQWFEGQTPSTAIDGAYSYPGENILTSAAVSQKVAPDANGNLTCAGPA